MLLYLKYISKTLVQYEMQMISDNSQFLNLDILLFFHFFKNNFSF